MEDEEDSRPPPPSVDAPLCYLRKCFKDARCVWVEAMNAEIVKKLQARLRKFELVERDLGGFMYLSPNKKPEFYAHESELSAGHHISTPHLVNVLLHLKVKIIVDNGFDETSLRVSMRKCGEVWKLQNSLTLGDHRLRITVKKVGSDDWTPVQFFPYPGGTPQDGTDFKHGDQLDMRYVYNAQTYPVSFDSTERTNYFPVTICEI